jgi:hypothetical protein
MAKAMELDTLPANQNTDISLGYDFILQIDNSDRLIILQGPL